MLIFVKLYYDFVCCYCFRLFGGGLFNFKYFFEVVLVGEWIMEVINRVFKIDLNNLEGLKLEKVRGEVEFKYVKFVYLLRLEIFIFEDFCLRVFFGKIVVLVGGSGLGKLIVILFL